MKSWRNITHKAICKNMDRLEAQFMKQRLPPERCFKIIIENIESLERIVENSIKIERIIKLMNKKLNKT